VNEAGLIIGGIIVGVVLALVGVWLYVVKTWPRF
jgi:hypothetical protein